MISIVIPVLNESENLPCLLDHLKDQIGRVLAVELIIVDGGSSDNTLALAQQFKDTNRLAVSLITSQRGRAKQMNAGAQAAKGEILYFLHADSFPPKHFDVFLKRIFVHSNVFWCTLNVFSVHFKCLRHI